MRAFRMLFIFAATFAFAAVATTELGRAADHASADAKLTAAVVGNTALQARCGGCIRKVEWIGASYPRLTVDTVAWQRLGTAERTAFARRALAAASAIYLEEWAAADIYQRIFIVDRAGKTLMSYEP